MNTQSENIADLAAALAKAQAEIQPAVKDSSNPFFKSKYADLSSVWNSCREPLSKNGLSVLQTMDTVEGKLMLVTTLAHSSGQWVKSSLPVCPVKNDPQSLGAAITYMRRYGLSSMVGVIADEDDDGNKASGNVHSVQSKNTSISKREAQELGTLLDSVPSYKDHIQKRLRDLQFESLDAITPEMYNSIKLEAIKQKAKLQEQQQKIA